jgi:3-oxoacyl-[acyl-carrier-protein] synthase II
MSMRRVVITGLGAITPVGNDTESTWESICNGTSGVATITQLDPEGFPSTIAGEVKGFDPETVVAKKDVRRYDRFSLFGMAAAQAAWADAGLAENDYEDEKCGTILGVGIGGLRTLEDNHSALIAGGPRKLSPFLIPAMISNLGPGNIAIALGLKGINYTVTSACTSGTHAIGESFRLIRDGMQDVVVTGGSEAAITGLGIGGFGRMRALSTRNDDPQRASRPFDKDRDGFVIGEGCGILVMEELENAKKRGAKIYAEVVGYGFSCDAYHITAPIEGGQGAIQCMSMALDVAGMDKKSIGYINAHGTSTPINDPAESRAIRKVFGDHCDSGLMVSSTKSMIGHLLGAAGGVEGVFLALALKHGVLPPTINLDEPDEDCTLDYIPNTAREVQVEAAMSNSFGFGGTNASIIFKRFE